MRGALPTFCAAASIAAFGAEMPAPRVYDFAPGGNATGHPPFTAATGFGFEPGSPNRFSIRLPEGNYRVTARFGRVRGQASVSLWTEQRRLMFEALDVSRAKISERSFIVNIRTPALGDLPANATGGTQVRLKPREIGAPNWDDKLSLEMSPDFAALRSLTLGPADVPTLYLAGDSTVTDQSVAPNASWGQMLPAFLAPDIAVANHAESGESLKSFVTGQRLDKLLSTLRTGDWVMIQFGHNDQKAQWPQTYADAATTYRSWLRTYIGEIRRRGATPLLVTSPDRRNFDDTGRVVSTLGDYPEAMRAIALEEHVALIDLNSMSRRFYEALGPEVAPRAFADDGRDRTHFNEYGAWSLARCVVEGLRAADPALTAELASHIAPGLARFDPDHPAPPPVVFSEEKK
jgi:lysophospholipase L1-like esterase